MRIFVYKLIELLGDLLKFLFVPSEERVTALFDMVSSKFSFVDDIKFAVLSLQDLILNANGAPRLTINLGSTKYTEATSIVIDFSWYEPFKAYGDLVITGFVYANFLWRLFIKSPGIVSGTSGSVVDFYEIREKNGGKG